MMMMTNFLKIAGIAMCFAVAASGWADNLLKSTQFGNDSSWYYTHINDAIKNAGGSATFKDGAAVMVVPELEKPACWYIQLKNKIDLELGKTYKLKMKIASDGAGQIAFNYAHGHNNYAFIIYNVNPGEEEVEKVFTVKPDDKGKFEPSREMIFFCGAFKKANLTLSDISLEEVTPAAPADKK